MKAILKTQAVKPEEREKYDILVFIGRFQPFHLGHKRVVDRALELAKNVLILVGSANRPRSMRNPLTFEERKEIIERVYSNDPKAFTRKEKTVVWELSAKESDTTTYYDFKSKLSIHPLDDVMYNDTRWIEGVQKTVKNEISKLGKDAKIGLIGCKKDNSSYYLKLFPTWADESVEFYDPINATDIRDAFFDGLSVDSPEINDFVPEVVRDYLYSFKYEKKDVFSELITERDFVNNYKTSVQKYPRIEHTVDSVVIQSGHILLVRRRAAPGKGMLALPGGFVHPDEKLVDAALRELREETKLRIPVPVLKGSIVSSETFDDPNRSDRGRIITQAFLIKLSDQTELPKVKGADDADKAMWVSLSDLDPTKMFEDHYWIISKLIGDGG